SFALGLGSKVSITGNVVNNGYLSTDYEIGGGNNTLNISGTLTNNDQFYVDGSGDVVNVGTLVNDGNLIVNTGATLNLSNGITDVVAGSEFTINGTFTAGANNAFYKLSSVEGLLYLANGQVTNVTPGGGTLTNSGNIGLTNGSTLSIVGNVTNSNYMYADGGAINISGNLTNSTNSSSFALGLGSKVSITGNVVNNGYLSTDYEIGGGNNTLNISGTLTNNDQFYVDGSGDVVNVGTLVNDGNLIVNTGATLNLSNGITDVVAGSEFTINGTFTAGANNAFYKLSSVEGLLYLANGQVTNVTPGGGTLTNSGNIGLTNGSTLSIVGNVTNSNYMYADGGAINISGNLTNSTNSSSFALGLGSKVSITGNVVNNGYLSTDYEIGGGNNTLNISGTLTNNDQFYVDGSGDVVNVGTLVNDGNLIVNTGATLNLSNGITDVVAGSEFTINGTFTAGANNAFYKLSSVEGLLYLANGQVTNVTPGGGTLTNSGNIGLTNGSTLSIVGNVTNSNYMYADGGAINISGNLTNSTNSSSFALGLGSKVSITGNVVNNGYLSTDYEIGGGNNTLNISGTLTNNDQFYVDGSGDVVNVGTLVNDGNLIVNTGATLNLSNGITDVVAGSEFTINGTFTAGANNAFYKLSSVEGLLYLANGQVTNVTPGGGTLTNSGNIGLTNGSTLSIVGNVTNSNYMYADGGAINISGNLTNSTNSSSFALGLGSKVSITGNVVNNGYLSTGYEIGGGNNTLNISGTLTNNDQFYVDGSGDVVNVGTLVNDGNLIVNTGATLNLSNGITDVVAGSEFTINGTFTAGAN